MVKWILLSPAVWPGIEVDTARNINAHTGGWVPNWVDAQTGDVLLRGGENSRHEREPR